MQIWSLHSPTIEWFLTNGFSVLRWLSRSSAPCLQPALAPVVSGALPLSSALTGDLNGYTLSTLVFYPPSSLPGILSPFPHSACGMVCLWKLFIILEDLGLHLGSLLWPSKQWWALFPCVPSRGHVWPSLYYCSNRLFRSILLLSFFLKVWPEEQRPQQCLPTKSTNALLSFSTGFFRD